MDELKKQIDNRYLSDIYKDGDYIEDCAKANADKYLDKFLSLPHKCQEMIFWYSDLFIGDEGYRRPYDTKVPYKNNASAFHNLLMAIPFDSCESPIEKIFLLAFVMVEDHIGATYGIWLPLRLQAKIDTEDHQYRADFLIDTSFGPFKNDYTVEHDIKLVIECDGYEYHNQTKEQVAYDNERDLALKRTGYDVIHFSGTQLYDNPWKCAENALSYALESIGKITRNDPEATDGTL